MILKNFRSKSILRSSSGTSYPYPRTHTTLMVAPSSRPIAPEEYIATKKQTTRRRPPLNRSIPPIPESKSNESIMSHASRRSSSEKVDNSQQLECVVIENRNAVNSFKRQQNSANRIPLISSTKNSNERRRQSKGETTPHSPLMTVAKTVKDKFSKLTKLGRNGQDVSMKGSQSFSGIRQPKSAIPKRIDQNANRVIKSSSMEVPSSSQATSGSSGSKRMVVIPQNPKNLEDFSEEPSVAETTVKKNSNDVVVGEVDDQPKSQEEPKQELSVTLNEDVLVVTRELPLSDLSDKRLNVTEASERLQSTHGKVTTFEEDRIKHISTLDETGNTSPLRKQHTFALGEKIPDTSSELKATEPLKNKESLEEKSKELARLDEMEPEPRFVIMALKTPESMRKHKTFFIDLTDIPVTGTAQVSSPKKKNKARIIKQRSMPEKSTSPERYVLKVKTPEALRRHHTFTIRERSSSPDVPYIEEGEITEPIATVGPTATKKDVTKTKEVKQKEKEKSDQKSPVSLKTPSALRKFKAYVTEDKLKQKIVSGSKSADTLVPCKTSFADLQDSGRATESQILLQSEKMQKTIKSDEFECGTLTTAVMPATNSTLHEFLTEEKKPYDGPKTSASKEQTEAVSKLEREKEIFENVPLKTSEMYVLTMMTPIPQRKETNVERIFKEKPPNRSASPENVSLFVIGRRSQSKNCKNSGEKNSAETEAARCAVVRPHRGKLELDRKDQSQSDRAERIERKNSELSGEMTSPEEEIPMDTHLTPTEELQRDNSLITRSIHRLPGAESTITKTREVTFSEMYTSKAVVEDSHQAMGRNRERTVERPVFQPPSPPKETFKPITLSKSTSPLKSKENFNDVMVEAKGEKKKLNYRSKSVDRKEKPEERERLKREKRDEKQKPPRSPRVPITARSLRSAGKMFAPSFFRRGDSKTSLKSPQVIQGSSSVTLTTKSRMNLPFRSSRKAPLAEFESLVVENSPAVENNPLIFEKWNSSPRGTKRHSASHINAFSEPIVEESDGNGNVCPPTPTTPILSNVQCMVSPVLTRHEPDRGLIDDEITDQPMLIGDTFSHSESIDCLSVVRRMEFEAEKATLISIDRSLTDDDTMPRRTFDNGNAQSSTVTRAATVFAAPPTTYCKAVEDGLIEVEDIRNQLEKLQRLVFQEMRDTEVEKLIRENEALRRELHEKNELIANLRRQIVNQRP
ncbi:hypothetical protein KIN20_037572 [Parelaphostrongylus tenuis]|uniref:Uncharacterized protein n=1 Tax=Parelaphostrongylus tenuis TaxID=148309 RepID=A0AAD5RET6_PARTN|nr:hypothetical protein KIN20_037572 [Parelaphostrongylus tenuis]